MGKVNISDLASILCTKHGLKRKEAQTFINNMVSIIHDALETDKYLKVKGLGVFKIVDVDARESVNVNTGERVTIAEHSKLAFVPDASMKDLVNKPFALFETVMLNEGVDFSDRSALDELADDAFPEEETADETALPQEDTSEEPEAEPAEEPELEPEADTIEKTIVEYDDEENEQEPVVIDNLATEVPAYEEEETDSDSQDGEDDDETPSGHGKRWIRWTLAVAALLWAGALAYYFLHDDEKDAASVPVVPVVTTPAADSTATDTLTVAVPEEVVTVHDWQYYDTLDSRLNTGAYAIIGEDHTVIVGQGDNTRRIALREAGSDQFACYIEAFNGITAGTPLEVGSELRIPKLVTKRSLRNMNHTNNNNNQ